MMTSWEITIFLVSSFLFIFIMKIPQLISCLRSRQQKNFFKSFILRNKKEIIIIIKIHKTMFI